MLTVPQLEKLTLTKVGEPCSFCSVDTETDGLYPYIGNKVFAFSLGWDNGTIEVYRIDGKDGSNPQIGLDRLQEIFDDITIAKVLHNMKFDLGFFVMMGLRIPPETVFHDTMIMSRMLRNWAPSHELDFLVWELLGEIILPDGTIWTREDDKRISSLAKAAGKRWDKVPLHEMFHYQQADAFRTILLFMTWYEDFKKDKLQYLDYQNEIELILTTQKTEEFGVRISRYNCEEMISWLEVEMQKVQDETWSMFGEYINWNSDVQIARILYKKLGMPVLDFTESGKPSTDKDTLFKLQEINPHKALDIVLRHRSYDDGIATIKSYLKLADEKGVIHPEFNTNVAHTGRQSAKRPNVQNLRKETVLKNPYAVPARKCFVVPVGYINYLVDYAGIEMRLIVGACGEPELLSIIEQNGDVHAPAAESFFGEIWTNRDRCFSHFLTKDAELKRTFQQSIGRIGLEPASEALFKTLRKTLRNAAKNAAFAKAYGAGLNKIALTLNLPKDIAGPGFETYCSRFRRVANFTKQMMSEVKEFRYITTAFGRKLNIPKNKSYIGSNYRIQGDAAGVLKRAENRTFKYSKEYWDSEIRIQNKIHDEIILGVPRTMLSSENEYCTCIRQLMIYMPQIQVPLDVEYKKTVTTWNDAKEFKPEYTV